MKPAPLVAITAKLEYSKEQAEELKTASETPGADLRPLLRRFHDEIGETLQPALTQMRAEGLIANHATSWRLGELAAHAPAARVDEAIERLAAVRGLKEVTRGAPLHGPGKRRR